MYGDIKVDVVPAVTYSIDRVLALFGKDYASREAADWLKQLMEVGVTRSATVQGIGMVRPIPISDIYQKTHLYRPKTKVTESTKSIFDLIDSEESAVIVAGPGSGKSTLLHWAFQELIKDNGVVPVLFTLRVKEAISDLSRFVKDLRNAKVANKKNTKIILLVDGYDEVTASKRRLASELLIKFQGMQRGVFFLTCRTHYAIIDLNAPHYYIERFTAEDAANFSRAFFNAHSFDYDADALIHELNNKGFGDFVGSPLMLTMVCVLKTGPLPELPKRTIGLLRRALDTLTFRWDEGKGISRDGAIALDGDERVRCLMRIAYSFKSPIGREEDALLVLEEHLKQLQRSTINPMQLLEEMARWYGIFVPTSDGQWEFVHRTLHDYLAARYWVESGELWSLGVIDWDTRAAYAACLVPDATEYLQRSLVESRENHVLAECLANNAPFDVNAVAQAMLDRVSNRKTKHCATLSKKSKRIKVTYDGDVWKDMSDQFLEALMQAGCSDAEEENDIVLALSLAEANARGITFKSIDRKDLRGYSFTVSVGDCSPVSFRLSDLIEQGAQLGRS